MINREIAEQSVKLLNEAFELDPESIERLVLTRIPCNEALTQHPTIQVGPARMVAHNPGMAVGLIGILNGIAGANSDSLGAIAVIVDNATGKIKGFQVLQDRFEVKATT